MLSHFKTLLRHHAKQAFYVNVKSSRTFVWSSTRQCPRIRCRVPVFSVTVPHFAPVSPYTVPHHDPRGLAYITRVAKIFGVSHKYHQCLSTQFLKNISPFPVCRQCFPHVPLARVWWQLSGAPHFTPTPPLSNTRYLDIYLDTNPENTPRTLRRVPGAGAQLPAGAGLRPRQIYDQVHNIFYLVFGAGGEKYLIPSFEWENRSTNPIFIYVFMCHK